MARALDPLNEFRNKGKQKPQMKDVEDHVVPRLAIQWRQLGHQLNIDENSLDILQHNYPNNCEECCSRMLVDWLDQNTHENTTWEILIDAIHRLPTGVDRELCDTLTAANDYLQKCYINSRYSPTVDEWPPYQPRHYTTLALIHHKDRATDATVISVTQELSVVGKLHEVGLSSSGGSLSQTLNAYSNTTNNISDIFLSVTASDGLTINPCIILIEGAPGIGKTVLAKEIAFQWANNKLLIDRKIVFLLFLRQCNFKTLITIQSFIQYIVKSDEITACLTKYLLQTEGKDLAIVFDGYDEVSTEDKKNSIIADIIHCRLFAKCCLVITSRPTASADLHSIVDCRVEIVGFTKEDRLDYIQTALQGDNNKVEVLTHYLQSNPTINALCYIPLNMTILRCLVEDGIDKLPKTQTDMYHKFIEMTILQFIRKIDDEAAKVITSIIELPCPYNKMFEELAKLAYKALNIDKIVFTLKEIKHICPNIAMMPSNWNGLGLLKAVQCFNTEIGNVTFHFLHFSIQEYMAAWYISTLSNNEQIKLLKSTFWKHRFYNTWIMYVGITHGSSFALKHFLSGNKFQLATKIYRSSNISNKLLKNKFRCLHLFQCFVESNNEDMITSVNHFLQGNQIDLSNQTLLPSDVNTLGFFLIRCTSKNLEMLNLASCNIGSIGINILCDRFLNEHNRHNITIKAVDFSFNQLNFSTLVKLFELFKFWHTSEIIIIDSEEILQNITGDELYTAFEEALILYHCNIRANIQFGSCLFAHAINAVPLLLSTVSLKSIYLMDCNWTIPETIPERSFHKLIKRHRYNSIHIIYTGHLIERSTLCIYNLINKNAASNIFVYSPALSDKDVGYIRNLMSSTIINGVRLVISSIKIQGIINTSNVNTELSRLEILNFIVKLRALYSNKIQTYSWRQDLCCNDSESDLMVDTFIGILHKINTSNDLTIALREKDTLIAYNVNYSWIVEKIELLHRDQPLRAVYLNNCNISVKEFKLLFDKASVSMLTSLCVYKCYLEVGCLMMLFTEFSCKESFIHTLCDIDTDKLLIPMSEYEDHSTLLVVKNKMLGYKPTTKQIVVALQLNSSINALKLINYKGTFDTFDQIMRMVVSFSINWTELDLSNCSIGETEYDIIYKYFKKTVKYFSTVNVLKLPSENLTISILSKLTEIKLIWKVQELVFCGDQQFISKFKSFCINTTLRNINISVACNSKKIHFVCNFNRDEIADIPKVSTLYFIKCYDLSFRLTSIVNHISEIYIINSTLYENNIINLLEVFINRKMELSICRTDRSINIKTLYSFITKKEIFYQSKMSFVAVMENIICGYNATKDQLHSLLSQRLCDLEYAVVSLAIQNYTKQMHKRVLFLFESKKLKLFYFVGMNNINVEAANDIATIVSHSNSKLQWLDLADNNLQAAPTVIIAKGLKEISTLKSLNISNNHITKRAAGNIAFALSCNTQLQELNISNNHLQASGAITLAKGLHDITTLTKFCISNNNITEEAAGDIAVFVSHNTQLQELDISNNLLQASGAMTLAKDLHDITTLTKFCIGNNNITEEAAGDIAVFVSHNTQLQELDISNNLLQASGAITLAKGLYDITTLTKFCISNNNITDEAAGDIAVFVSHNTQLQELDISKNLLQVSGARTLTKGLYNITTLTKLFISGKNITEEAASDIASSLYHHIQSEETDVEFIAVEV